MTKPNDKSSEPDWRQEPWASRKAKHKEKYWGEEEPWKKAVEKARRKHEKNPEKFARQLIKLDDNARDGLKKDIKHDNTIVAGISGDYELVEMQDVIDEMANECGLFKRPPKLIIHKRKSEYNDDPDSINASVMLPEFIHINTRTKKHFLKHPDQFRASMAHELGHLANGDVSTDSAIKEQTAPPNQKEEVLANRMGAIIHGSPRAYAKAFSDLIFFIDKDNGIAHHKYSDRYTSTNAIARMLHKWADILEREGGTDDKGNVTDATRETALKIFERSKEFAEDLLYTDRAYLKKLQKMHKREEKAQSRV